MINTGEESVDKKLYMASDSSFVWVSPGKNWCGIPNYSLNLTQAIITLVYSLVVSTLVFSSSLQLAC